MTDLEGLKHTDDPQALLKIVFVGDSGVGKTSLIERMFNDQFLPSQPATIGTDAKFKRMIIDDRSVGISVWDTAGQDRFKSITPFYYRGAQGVVYVYDVTDPGSLTSLADLWMRDFQLYKTFDAPVQMVVGNKTDLGTARQVSAEEGAAFAREHGCLYKETSAKTEEGVYDALVWGLVCSIIDSPDLMSHSSSHNLPVAPAAGEERQRNRNNCC